MNDNPMQAGEKKQESGDVNFGVFSAVIVLGHAIGMAMFIGPAALILNIPVRSLLAPYVALVYCGFVLAPLGYWVRLSRRRPESFAIRMGITMFLYLQVLMLAMGFGVIRLGILSRETAINDYAPYMILFSAFASFLSYLAVRQTHKDRESE